MICAKLVFVGLCYMQAVALAQEDTGNCTALPENNVQGQHAMLQHSELHHMTALLHTQTSKDLSDYTMVGDGVCADEDLTKGPSLGWSQCTCGKPTGSSCGPLFEGTCATVDNCASDCDAEPGCAAFGWVAAHCWLYAASTKLYTKTVPEFTIYKCYSKLSTTTTSTTSTTTTTTAACVPYSVEACQAASSHIGMQFIASGDYTTKGCYTYDNNKQGWAGSTYMYHGYSYYGLGGSDSEMQATVSVPKVRVPGYDCTPCEPYSLHACMRAARTNLLYLGGNDYDFIGDYGTKGCYTYPASVQDQSLKIYVGFAFFGTGGTDAEMQGETEAILGAGKMRVPGWDSCEGPSLNDKSEYVRDPRLGRQGAKGVNTDSSNMYP